MDAHPEPEPPDLAHRDNAAIAHIAAFFLKLRARANSMLRQVHAARPQVQRVQAERHNRETDAAAADRAAWTEQCAIGLMADAPGRAPMAEPPPEPAPVQEPKPDLIAEAELYAAMYPRRAALIRQEGRVHDNASFGPPDEDLLPVLVNGRTPALPALDREQVEA
jgi:hypothetical protein